jgi:hypothetical protein
MVVFAVAAIAWTGCSESDPVSPGSLDSAASFDREDVKDCGAGGENGADHDREDGSGDYGGSDR